MSAKDEDVSCYVAITDCGCVVACHVDDGSPSLRASAAEAVSDWIKDGLSVERKTVGWTRENLKFCKHKAEGRTP